MATNKLQKALKIVITSLKNDTIMYNWHEQTSCNCGLVAQALLIDTKVDLGKGVREWTKELSKISEDRILKDKDRKKISTTWQNGVKWLCPITGLSKFTIFNELFERGLKREDIVHLEFMSNKAILDRSGLNKVTKVVTKRIDTGETETIIRTKPHSNFFKRLVGITEDENIQRKIFKTVEKTVVETTKDNIKADEKDNLILYLTAWLEILSEKQVEDVTELNHIELESELLKSLNNEDYEKASEIRDKILELDLK